MNEGEIYLKALDTGYFEVGEAFKGLANEHVWQRPAAGLLSIGELAGHIAYWEAARFTGEGANIEGHTAVDLEKCRVKSPLIDHRFRYYPQTLAESPSEQLLEMTAEQVCAELVRVHEESMAYFKLQNPDLDSDVPGWSPKHTYRFFLEYAAFHIAYHTGQMYTARHLLGEETPDN